MNIRVRGVYKLAGNEGMGNFLGQLLGSCDRAGHSLCAFGQNKLCTVCFQQISAFNTHGFRHRQNNAIAVRSRHRSQADTGVSAGRLNDDRLGIQQPLFLSVFDHRLGNSVLYTSGWIKIFQLTNHSCLQLVFLFIIGKFQKRGFSDQICQILKNLCHKTTS